MIVTTVGSSSPNASGSAGPFTFGSSLRASVTPLTTIDDWLATWAPLAMTPASVTSNSTITLPPAPPRTRLRTSSSPEPCDPPFGSVPEASAPAGTVTSTSEPGWKAGGEFSASSSSASAKLDTSMSPTFSMRSV